MTSEVRYSFAMSEAEEPQLNLGLIASERIEVSEEILDMLPEEAISPLTCLIAENPGDRDATLALGLCLFHASDVLRGCDVVCNLARRLIYQGRVLKQSLWFTRGCGSHQSIQPFRTCCAVFIALRRK